MYEKIIISESHLKFAFTSDERPYIRALANRANYLLDLINSEQNTKAEKLEYYSLKWALKNVGALNKEDLERVENK